MYTNSLIKYLLRINYIFSNNLQTFPFPKCIS